MHNILNFKLIAIVNSIRMIIYEAKGIKIINKAQILDLTLEKTNHQIHTKNQNHYYKKSDHSSLLIPHNTSKNIEYKETAKIVTKHLEQIVNNIKHKYKELIIVAEPKMLGYIRQALSHNLKKILTKDFTKDLINHNVAFIEQTIFAKA